MLEVNAILTRTEILNWLRQEDPNRLEELWRWADEIRRLRVGNEVHLRGLVEISNYCARQCAYCGLRAGNGSLARYRMTASEIHEAARMASKFGYGTVVLQAGEDEGITREWMTAVIRRIKMELDLAVTLSLGERSEDDWAAWREAGADRYLLRFETSDRALFNRIHPGKQGKPSDRIAMLYRLRELGYETGSGMMVGLPGQSYASVAEDIGLFQELDLDMIGIGPFIAHPATPLGRGGANSGLSPEEQAPNTELMVYKAVALTRLMRPDANIPSTTALATINPQDGRELGLRRGANVVMPCLTPTAYRRLYEIYPSKACVDETGSACHQCLQGRLLRIGRQAGRGPGGRRERLAEDPTPCLP